METRTSKKEEPSPVEEASFEEPTSALPTPLNENADALMVRES